MAEDILSSSRPCKKCGESDRYASGGCKSCAKAQAAAWRSENLERKKALNFAWRATNKDRVLASDSYWNELKKAKRAEANSRKTVDFELKSIRLIARRESAKVRGAIWYAANKARVSAVGRTWRLANPDAVKRKNNNRRARTGSEKLSKGVVDRLFKLQKGKCPCCKRPLGSDYHLDHIVPMALGGTNSDDNVQLLRKQCNLQKHAKHPVDFMRSRGYLL